MRLTAFACLALVLNIGAVYAQNEYHITAAEKAACTVDAERLCLAAYPDEQKLLVCLRANIGSLSANCATVFKAGLKRRGLRQ